MEKAEQIVGFSNTELKILGKAVWIAAYYSRMHFFDEELEILERIKSRIKGKLK